MDSRREKNQPWASCAFRGAGIIEFDAFEKPPYRQALILVNHGEDDIRWAFRWFVLVSILLHGSLLLLMIKDPALLNRLEDLIAPQKPPMTEAMRKKLAEERKPVFVDILDPSKVPQSTRTVAPPLPKGHSLSGKPNHHDSKTVLRPSTAPPPPRVTAPRPKVAPSEPEREAPLAKMEPGLSQVKKSARHDHPNHNKAKETEKHSERMAKTAPVSPSEKPEKPTKIVRKISPKDLNRILSQESLGDPFSKNLNLSKDLSPAYSDKPDPTDRIMANLEDETYSSYIKRIQERFETIGEYPEEAASRGITGRALVTFRILADGTLDGVTLSRSSGSAILDEEALRIVRVASPYIPLPTAFHKKELTLTWAFIFYNGGFHVIQ